MSVTGACGFVALLSHSCFVVLLQFVVCRFRGQPCTCYGTCVHLAIRPDEHALCPNMSRYNHLGAQSQKTVVQLRSHELVPITTSVNNPHVSQFLQVIASWRLSAARRSTEAVPSRALRKPHVACRTSQRKIQTRAGRIRKAPNLLEPGGPIFIASCFLNSSF